MYSMSRVLVVLVLVAAFVGINRAVSNSGSREKKTVALTLGDTTLSNAELSYYFIDTVNNFYSQNGTYAALYGLVAQVAYSYVTDTVLYGLDKAKVAYIITQQTDPVVEALTHDLGRGVTLLHGQGAWSGQEKQVLMCAFKQRQIVAVRQTVKELDPDAFLIVCDAREVLGRGFTRYKKNAL